MKINLQTTGVDLKLAVFNNNEMENGVKCADLDKLLKFENINDFNTTIKELTDLSPSLTS